MIIDTSYERGFGCFTNASNKADPRDFTSSSKNSTAYGWNCAQTIKENNHTQNILHLIPIYTGWVKQEEETQKTIAFIQEWLSLIEDTFEAPGLFIFDGVPVEDPKCFSYDGEIDEHHTFFPIIQLGKVLPLNGNGKLAFFTLLRYLYRHEFYNIPKETFRQLKAMPQKNFLLALFLASRRLGLTNTTFMVHAQYAYPILDGKTVLKRLRDHSILDSFGINLSQQNILGSSDLDYEARRTYELINSYVGVSLMGAVVEEWKKQFLLDQLPPIVRDYFKSNYSYTDAQNFATDEETFNWLSQQPQ